MSERELSALDKRTAQLLEQKANERAHKVAGNIHAVARAGNHSEAVRRLQALDNDTRARVDRIVRATVASAKRS